MGADHQREIFFRLRANAALVEGEGRLARHVIEDGERAGVVDIVEADRRLRLAIEAAAACQDDLRTLDAAQRAADDA